LVKVFGKISVGKIAKKAEELKQPRKHPTSEKVDAIKDALKHFQVI